MHGPFRIALPILGLILLALAPLDAGTRPSELRAATDGPARVLISALFADGYAAGEGDEALQLWNISAEAISLGAWQIDDGEGQASFPEGARIEAGARVWLAREAEAFARSFGQAADWVWAAAEDGPRMLTVAGGPRLANGGDELALVDRKGHLVDRLVYGKGGSSEGWQRAGWADAGWIGPALEPYAGGVLGASNQLLGRKLDPVVGRPLPDTNTSADWAADPADPILGRRPRYPGWDLETRFRPARVQGLARVEVALAPDGLRAFLLRHFASAEESLDLMVYSFENPVLAEAIAERAQRGVRVRLLLEGRPAGGIDLAQRWCLARIAEAGGQVWWMDRGGEVGPRYRGAHAKLALIDGRRLLIGSENPNLGSTPGDDLADGTAGRRGAYAMIEHPGVAEWARQLFADDLAPEAHVDLRPFQARDPERGAPPADYVPERVGGGSGYFPIAAESLQLEESMRFDLVTSPENSLDPLRGLPGLVGRAGQGDRVLVQQLDEPLWWGEGPEEGPVALNPRVQAFLGAARRGAQVRLLLDGYFDDAEHWNSNQATADALMRIAAEEGLDLQARLGNPAGKGLHNKMLLVTEGCAEASRGAAALGKSGSNLAEATPAVTEAIGTSPLAPGCRGHWSHLGSINGSEVASKANREAGVSIDSEAVHVWLEAVFAWDWARSGANTIHLPVLALSTRTLYR